MTGPRDDAPATRAELAAGAERTHWERRHAAALDACGARGEEARQPPSEWVMRCLRTLPAGAMLADLACGTGRHAIPLAAHGFRVIAIDLVERAVAAVRDAAPDTAAVVADAAALPLRAASLDAIVCVSFLDRSVVPVLHQLLRSGGALVYETFTVEHGLLVAGGRARGPRNPAYLLAPGELRALVGPLDVIAEREGLVVDAAGERHVASVMAVKRT